KISDKIEGAATVIMGFAGPENGNSNDKIYLRAVNQFLFGLANARIKDIEQKYSTRVINQQERLGTKPSDKTAILLEASLPENNVEPMLKDMYQVLNSLSMYPPTEAEFNAIKTHIKKVNSQALQSSYELNQHIGMNFLNGDKYQTANYSYILDNMTYQDFINTARKYYDLNKVSLTIVHPKGTKPEDIQNNYSNHTTNQVPFSGKKQVSFSGRNEKLPTEIAKIREFSTPNNFKISMQDSNSDVVNYNISLVSNKIIGQNPVVTEVLNEMLQYCGTYYRDKNNLASIYDYNGINKNIAAGDDSTGINADFPVDKTDVALALFRENILTPAFTQDLFEKSVRKCLDKYQTMEPSAYDKYDQEMYKNLPDGVSKEERIQQLSQITLGDVINLYNQLLANGQGQITVTGPFSKYPGLVNSIYNNATSYHMAQPNDISLQNVYTPTEKAKVFTKETNKNQAMILEGFKYKTNLNAKDSICLELLSYILGGSSSSRLFKDLREQRHLAYSVRAYQHRTNDMGMMTLRIETTTNNTETGEKTLDNIKKSIDGFNENIKKISTEKISEEELETAKKALKNIFLQPTEMDECQNLMLVNGMRTPYGAYYANERYKLIDTITPEDILNTAKYIFSNKPVYSIAGTKEALDSNQEYLKTLGEIS
ncbi:insulinase family protein, partial [bacterium]|nr:insulinase family protein [bacterium]